MKPKDTNPPKETPSRRELGDRLRTRRQREDAQDIITIRSRQEEETVSLSDVLKKHQDNETLNQ